MLTLIFFSVDRGSSRTNVDNLDLMDMRVDNELSVLDIFDPLKQSVQPPVSPPVVSPIVQTLPSSPSFPYPIKLRLTLTACAEMKPFSELVQQIRNDRQFKQVDENEFL